MAEPLPPSPSDSDASSAKSRAGEPRVDGAGGRTRARGAVSERARSGGLGASEPKSKSAIAASVAIHVVLGVALLQLLTFGHGISSFFGFDKRAEPREERLTFVSPPQPKKPVPARIAPKTEPTATSESPRLRAPSTGPVVGPPEPAPVAARPDTGSGAPGDGARGVGALDPNVKGVKPGYTDVRVWRGTGGGGAGVASGRNGADKLDSVMRWAITSAADSLDSLARSQGKYGRKPGDWTKTTADGEKWGWDQTGIRLGKVTIPNALLGLLPLNAQKGMSGNFTELERDKRLSLARADIMRNSERALGEAEFKKLVSELRDRREKERRDRLRAPDASVVAGKSGTP